MHLIARFAPLLGLAICLSCTSKTDTSKTETTGADTTATATTSTKKKVIVFFGNSLAAGYGLENTADAFPNRIGARIDSLGLPIES